MAAYNRVGLFLGFVILCSSAAPARTVYVAQNATGASTGNSWQDAFVTIGAGITASRTGDEIWVRSATYTEALLLKNNVALYGGFIGSSTDRELRNWVANPTVVDASGLAKSVVSGANGARLDGFVVTGGSGTQGGGIACYSNTMDVANCVITGNVLTGVVGGGVFASGGSVRFTRCRIENNQAARGGGLYFEGGAPVLEECEIVENLASAPSNAGSGGGIYCQRADAQIRRCRIVANQASTGGGVYCINASPEIVNSVLTGNVASFQSSSGGNGGAMYASASHPRIIFSTLHGNSTGQLGGGIIYVISSTPVFDNSIVWNAGTEFAGPQAAQAVVTNSIVEGGYNGAGNLDADPLFVSAWDGQQANIHLQANSPAVDAGVCISGIDVDYEGGARPQGESCDIGADEFRPGTGAGPEDLNEDGAVNSLDVFYFSRCWLDPAQGAAAICNVVADQSVNDQDLQELIPLWRAEP